MAGKQSASTEDADLSTLVSSASLVLVGSLFGSASKLIEQVIIGNVISTAAFGKVNAGISMMMLSVTIAMVGFEQGIPRFMARFNDERDVRGVWVTGIALAGTLALVVAGVLLLSTGWVLDALFPSSTPTLLPVLFVVAIPFVVGLKVAVGTIRGLENTIYRTISYDLLYNGVRLGLLIALLLAGVGVLAAGYAYVVGAAVALVVAHLLLNRIIDFRGPFRTHGRALVRFSAPLVVSTVVSTLLARIDTLMLAGLLPGSVAEGVYSYGYTLAAGLPVVLSVFGFLYLPLASRLDADGDHEEVDRVYKVTTKWIYIAAFPAFLTFVAFSGDLVSAVFPKSGPRAAAAFVILSVGFFTSAASGRSQDTLSAFGYTDYILVINTASAALNIVLNLALIPAFGVVGAAFASALSYIALNTIAMLVLWRLSGISPFSRVTVRAFLLLPLVLFPPALLLSRAVTLSLFTLPAFAVFAGLVSVALVAVTGCLQPEDEIPIELIEDRLGIRIPLIRRYIPPRNP